MTITKGGGASRCHLAQPVDDAAILGRGIFREARPGAAREFADIDVAAAVDRDAVRRGELPRQDTGMRLAELGQPLAFQRVDADPRPDIRPVAVDLAGWPALADIAERVTPVPEAHAVRAVQIVPLRLPFAVAVEHLHAVVLAVGDIEPALRVAADIVRDVELAGIGDRDRGIPAIEGVDIVLAVDPDCGAIAEHDLIGYLGPALLDLETPLAAAEPLRHRRLPFVAPCHHRRGPTRQARASVLPI